MTWYRVTAGSLMVGIYDAPTTQAATEAAVRDIAKMSPQAQAKVAFASGGIHDETLLNVCQLQDAPDTIVVPRKTFDALVAALAAIQWSCVTASEDGSDCFECPSCGRTSKHDPKCKIGDALKLAEAVPR